ncbi:rho GTPase-activating protein gacZ isoform X4 [Hydra vulgaris]|uniref:Rho GTPase-activating protein gacZ isoform X4 n=1 Tax=Hydra vulgaris TaxID=6087 RepID=A0ABM4C2W7_HYDVU
MTSSISLNELYCFYCGVDNIPLLRCVQCKSIWYCSREHQKNHWSIHKSFCKQKKKELVSLCEYEKKKVSQYSHSQLNKTQVPFILPESSQRGLENTLSSSYLDSTTFVNVPIYKQHSNNVHFHPQDKVPYGVATNKNFLNNLCISNVQQDSSIGSSSPILSPSKSTENYSFAETLFASENFLGSGDTLTNLLDNPTLDVIDFGDAASLYLDTVNLHSNDIKFEEKLNQLPFQSSSINNPSQNLPDIMLGNSFQSNHNLSNPTLHFSNKLYKSNQINQDLEFRNMLCQTSHNISNQALHIRTELYQRGYCIIDNFLSQEFAKGVLADVNTAFVSGAMQAGQIVNRVHNKDIRGDYVMWLSGHEEQYEFIIQLTIVIDQLIAAFSKLIHDVVIKGRTPRDGGMLRLYTMNERVNIEPIFNRLLLFWSDKRTPHEVLPSFRKRFAITLWYFDAAEREVVKQAYFQSLQSQFASCGRGESQAS